MYPKIDPKENQTFTVWASFKDWDANSTKENPVYNIIAPTFIISNRQDGKWDANLISN